MSTTTVTRCASCALTLLFASAGYAALDDGLVSYWPLDGDFADERGVNDGTFVGSSPSFDTGAFGQGIDLNGDDQYVNVGNHPSLDMSLNGPAQNGHVTISAWFRVDSFDTGWQALMSKGEGTNFRIARRAEGSVISYAGGTGDIPTEDLIGPSVNDSTLHHIVAITEGGVSSRLWVDGALVATNEEAPAISNAGNLDFLLGENPAATGRQWDGLIDDVAIWNRPLTDSEIGDLWNGGDGASVGSLITDIVPGDVNGDSLVNGDDFEVIRQNFSLSVASRADGDLDADGIVGFSDFRQWKDNAGAAAAAIPEPSALVLVAASVSLIAARRLRPAS